MPRPRGTKNVAASVRQQLLNRVRASDRPFNEILQHFAMERFLYRLAMSPHADRFVLKGALMMRVWKVPASRPTMAFAEDALKRKQWQALVRKSQLESAPADLVDVVRSLAVFLRPVVEGIAAGQPLAAEWSARGPWVSQ